MLNTWRLSLHYNWPSSILGLQQELHQELMTMDHTINSRDFLSQNLAFNWVNMPYYILNKVLRQFTWQNKHSIQWLVFLDGSFALQFKMPCFE